MSRILKPHREQEGAVYVRALRVPWSALVGTESVDELDPALQANTGPWYLLPRRSGRGVYVAYDDSLPACRTISSRRVEEAVETMDYLKRCEDEELVVMVDWCHSGGKWGVAPSLTFDSDTMEWGYTLREAYHRYHQTHDPS